MGMLMQNDICNIVLYFLIVQGPLIRLANILYTNCLHLHCNKSCKYMDVRKLMDDYMCLCHGHVCRASDTQMYIIFPQLVNTNFLNEHLLLNCNMHECWMCVLQGLVTTLSSYGTSTSYLMTRMAKGSQQQICKLEHQS